MLAWKPTRDLAPGEFKNGVLVIAVGLGVTYFVAGVSAVPRLAACLLYLAAVLTMAAIGAPDWLSQVLRRAPTRGGTPPNDLLARAFLLTGSIAALLFAVWAVLR